MEMAQVNSQNGRVLPDLTQLTQAQLVQMLLDAQAKLEAAPKQAKASFKVSSSGCCSVYHGSRFPVSLYRQQWAVVIACIEDGRLQKFLKDNAANLPLKGE